MFARLWSPGKMVLLEKEDWVENTPVTLSTQHINGIFWWACVLLYCLCSLMMLSKSEFPPGLRFHALQFPLHIVVHIHLSVTQLCEAQRLCCVKVKNEASQVIFQGKWWWSQGGVLLAFFQEQTEQDWANNLFLVLHVFRVCSLWLWCHSCALSNRCFFGSVLSDQSWV